MGGREGLLSWLDILIVILTTFYCHDWISLTTKNFTAEISAVQVIPNDHETLLVLELQQTPDFTWTILPKMGTDGAKMG